MRHLEPQESMMRTLHYVIVKMSKMRTNMMLSIAPKPDNLSSICKTYMVGENCLLHTIF